MLVVGLPCIKCGVKNRVEIHEEESLKCFMFKCPSCKIGVAYLDGVIHSFGETFLSRISRKTPLELAGSIVGTDYSSRFSSVTMTVRGSECQQKGSVISEEYLSKLGPAIEKSTTCEEILDAIEYPEEK